MLRRVPMISCRCLNVCCLPYFRRTSFEYSIAYSFTFSVWWIKLARTMPLAYTCLISEFLVPPISRKLVLKIVQSFEREHRILRHILLRPQKVKGAPQGRICREIDVISESPRFEFRCSVANLLAHKPAYQRARQYSKTGTRTLQHLVRTNEVAIGLPTTVAAIWIRIVFVFA